MFLFVEVIGHDDVKGSIVLPPKQESAWLRGVIGIIFNDFSGGNHMPDCQFADTSLVHALNRVNSKYQPFKNHSDTL